MDLVWCHLRFSALKIKIPIQMQEFALEGSCRGDFAHHLGSGLGGVLDPALFRIAIDWILVHPTPQTGITAGEHLAMR